MSSLLEQASVIITPNAYKEGKLYGLKGTDLDVVRATTATRVNSEGLIEEVPYNLLSYSEQFDNASWVKTNATITANSVIAPDGTLTADTINVSVQDVERVIQRVLVGTSISGSTYTGSIWIKGQGSNIGKLVRFRIKRNSGGTSSDVVVNYTLTSNWVRISATFTGLTDNTGIAFGFDGATNYADSFDVWGAQLVQGTQPKEYLRTETRLNIPRLDYTNGSCPSILVEPQRTNLALYSEEFDNAYWTKTGAVTINANATQAPNGTMTADTAENLGGSGNIILRLFTLSVITGSSVTISLFVKNQQRIIYFGGATDAGTDVYTQQDVGNGYFRQILTRTFSATNASATIQFILGGSLVPQDDYVIWGAQLEAGANATSYIPTVASAVTRNADVISKTGISDLIGQSEGSVFVDVKVSNLNSDLFLFNLNLVNNIIIGVGSGNIRTTIYANSVAYNFTNFLISNNNLKIAVGYKSGDSVLYINGVLISTLTSVFSFSGLLNDIYINRSFIYGNNSNNYNSVSVSKTRLSNDELQQITTL